VSSVPPRGLILLLILPLEHVLLARPIEDTRVNSIIVYRCVPIEREGLVVASELSHLRFIFNDLDVILVAVLFLVLEEVPPDPFGVFPLNVFHHHLGPFIGWLHILADSLGRVEAFNIC